MQQVGIEPGRARGITSKPSMYSPVLVPANIFQKQEQLQLAEASFRDHWCDCEASIM